MAVGDEPPAAGADRASTRVERPNVVLTGFMGTGKTTVGRLLAHRLQYEFVDTDVLIEARGETIAEIFRSRGEDAFREIEHALAADLAARRGLVVSTGGRMMLDPRNDASLGRSGRVFCLVASPDAILARVHRDDPRRERPLLSVGDPRARIVELLAERAAGYARFEQVETDGREPGAVVDDIEARLNASVDAPRARPG